MSYVWCDAALRVKFLNFVYNTDLNCLILVMQVFLRPYALNLMERRLKLRFALSLSKGLKVTAPLVRPLVLFGPNLQTPNFCRTCCLNDQVNCTRAKPLPLNSATEMVGAYLV